MANVDFAAMLKIFVDAKDYHLAADVGKLLKSEDAYFVVNSYPEISNKKKSAAKALIKEFISLLAKENIFVREVYQGSLKAKFAQPGGCWATAEAFQEMLVLSEKRREVILAEAEKLKKDNVIAALQNLSHYKALRTAEIESIRASTSSLIPVDPPAYVDPAAHQEEEEQGFVDAGAALMARLREIKDVFADIPEWMSDEQIKAVEDLKEILPSCESLDMIEDALKQKLGSVGLDIINGSLIERVTNIDDDDDDDEGAADGTDSEEGQIPERRYVNTSAALKDFWAITEHTKFDVMQKGVVIHEHTFNVDNVVHFMTENTLDNSEIRDITFAVIIVKLTSVGLITANREGLSPRLGADANRGQVNLRKLNVLAPLAKTMAVVALHAYSQGINDDVIPWYNSFCAVKGTFLSELRFSMIAKLIIYSQQFSEIMDLITVGDVIASNNVLKYRLSRLSTPSLIKKALQSMPFGVIYEKFKVAELKEYIKFEKGGVLAQIAAGPLAPYCQGKADPLKLSNIPMDYPLSSLQAIPKAPYYPSIIKKAKIIMDIMKIDYGRWYQGEKAAKEYDLDDFMFMSLAKAVHTNMRAKTGEVEVEVETYKDYHRVTKTVEERKVKKMVEDWV